MIVIPARVTAAPLDPAPWCWVQNRLGAPMTSLTVSKLAKAAGVELSAIRYYERRALVRPDAR